MWLPSIKHRHVGIGSARPILFLDVRKRFKTGATSAPPAVDTAGLAQAQNSANRGNAELQSVLNNNNTFSPFGSSTFTQPNGPEGQWQLNQTLNPTLQTAFNNQSTLAGVLSGYGKNVADIASSPAGAGANIINSAYNSLGGQIPTGPVDTSGLTALPSSSTDFSNEVNSSRDAAYKAQTNYLDPQFAQKSSDLRQQLADQGIGVGSDAYSRATGDLGRQSQAAYQQAQDAAVQAGNQEQAALFGENLGSRQQGFNEAVTKWGEPLSALSTAAQTGGGILSNVTGNLTGLSPLSQFEWGGQIPTFGNQGTVVPQTNLAGIQNSANSAAANRFTAGNTLNNQLFNGIGSLGGALGLGNGGLGSALGLGNLFGSGAGAAADFGGGGAALGVPDVIEAAGAAGASGWIICTELMRRGRMPKRHWLAGSPVFVAYPEAVKRGYYLWAIPSVRHLREKPNSLYSRGLAKVFGWRAENIAAHRGVPGARKLWRGAAVTAVLYPICKLLGYVAPEQDWAAVYREERA